MIVMPLIQYLDERGHIGLIGVTFQPSKLCQVGNHIELQF